MRILIVDDNEDSRDLTEAALVSAGYQDVRAVNSAWEAFKVLDIGRVPPTASKPANAFATICAMPTFLS
jgi:CheY-like chemotaxis protein